jgi:ribosomal protein S19
VDRKVYTGLLQRGERVYFVKKKNSVIVPEFVGLRVCVYNGRRFSELVVTSSMVGYRLGAFVFTRKLHVFKKKR